MPYLHNIFTVYEILSDMFLCFQTWSVCGKQKPKRVKAMYNCVADNPDELTFSEGEVIVVDGEEDQEWWVSILTAAHSLYIVAVVWEREPERKSELTVFPFLLLAAC